MGVPDLCCNISFKIKGIWFLIASIFSLWDLYSSTTRRMSEFRVLHMNCRINDRSHLWNFSASSTLQSMSEELIYSSGEYSASFCCISLICASVSTSRVLSTLPNAQIREFEFHAG